MERGNVKDLEFLVLADLAYERYEDKDNNNPLKDILLKHHFNNSERQQRWNYFTERMEGWKLLEGFDLSKYKREYEGKHEDIKAQYEGFYAAAFEKDNEIVIAYRGTDKEVGGKKSFKNFMEEHIYTNGQIVCGMPGIQFKLAEDFYNKILNAPNNQHKTISITGHSLGGGLSQYVSVIGAENISKTVIWNGVGVAGFSRMNGYELFGTEAILTKLSWKEIFDSTGEKGKYILKEFIQAGFVKTNGTYLISLNTEFVDIPNSLIKIPTKEELKNIISKGLDEYLKSNANGLNHWDESNKIEIEKNSLTSEDSLDYSIELLERKKIFMDNYYNKDINLIAYSISKDVTGTVFKHVGKRYLVDKNLKEENKGIYVGNLLKVLKEKEANHLDAGAYHGLTMFYPHIKTEEKNRGGKSIYDHIAKEEDIMEIVNKDYLQSYIKGLLKYIGIKDNEELKEKLFYAIYYKENTAFLRDVLLKELGEKLYKELPERKQRTDKYFSKEDKLKKELIEKYLNKYKIINSIEQLEDELRRYKIDELIKLEVKKGEVKLKLGFEEDEKKVIIYNEKLGIDTKEKEITLKITTPSKYLLNIEREKPNNDYELYSSLGYKDKYYNIRNIGKNSKVTADGKDISGTYKGKDKEESLVKDKINRDTGCKYYGDNLILMDRNLRYYYGNNLDDYLTISNYMEGYLGIDLIEKPKEKKEDLGKGFMDYQVKIKGIKYVNLLNLEIIKEVNEHTVAEIEGIIAGEDTDEVTRFLNVEKQGIEILYGDDNKPIFRGLIYEHSMEIEQNSCKVKIKSYSLSKELEKEKRNRVYHNLGTKYEDVISKLNETYQNKYSFGFNSHIDKQELITELNPVEVQYKESDWDFLKRIVRRENDLIIVDDSKGKNPKTVAGIAIGEFGSSQKTIDNKNLLLSRKMKKRAIENSYKLKGYPQIKGEELFSIGNPYNINIDVNTGKQDSLLLIKNRIYKESGVLKSDLVFVRRDEFNIGVVKREESITGLTLKGTIKKVSKQHKAQIEYTEMENEYDESKSYYYPIERMYTGTYFTPEEDTLVEVHFGAEAGEVSIRNVSSKTEDIDNDPDVKIIRTSFGKEVRFDSKSIKITGKDDESYVEITEESVGLTKGEKEIILKDGKIGINNKDSTITMDDKKVNITTGGSAIKMKDDKLTLDNGGVGIEIGNGKINLG
ncbi:hypothetical protein [Haliovirga abyssi]|uniref:DUF2974 domain-containing protein n=1 Tax=Haliovirga abyssi TaxID=2996794 RepID=A0AAU9DXN4_9FUSO|nr:hypothetical protein [Haliovirga abyssi]BDU51241.1 hypothetical protein HLVA_18100 [Haliovirga abyssi]